MRILRTTAVFFTLLCPFSYASSEEPPCDCHLVECDGNNEPVVSFWTSTPVQAVVEEGDSVANQTVFDRDLDVRPAVWVPADEFQLVEDAIGIQAEMDDGDGWVLMDFSFALSNRRQFNSGACSGFNTPVHQQVLIIVGSDGRQIDGTWPFYLPAGWSDAPVGVSGSIHFQPYSTILTELEYDGDGESRETSFTGDMTSADRNTKVRFHFTYSGDIPYIDASFNLRSGNFPLPTTSGQYLYCNEARTRATIDGDDPNLTMSLQAKGGRICLPLEDLYGDPICLTPRKQKGRGGQIEVARLQLIRYGGIECELVDMPDPLSP